MAKKTGLLTTGSMFSPKVENEKTGLLANYEPRKNRGSGLGYAAANLGLGIAGVFEGAGKLIVGTGAKLSGDHAYAEYVFKKSQVGEWKRELDNSYNPGTVMSFVGDVGQGIGQSSAFLLNAAVPGAGTALFFTGAIGNSTSEAVQKTGEVGLREYVYGAASGAAEGLLEKYVGAGGAAAGRIAGKIGSNVVSKTVSKAATDAAWKGVVKNMVSEGAGEFVEEFLSEYINTGLQRATGVDKNASTSLAQAAYAGFVGFASGAAMSGGVSAVRTSADYASGRRVEKNGNAEVLLNTARRVASGFETSNKSKLPEALALLKTDIESYDKYLGRKAKKAANAAENATEAKSAANAAPSGGVDATGAILLGRIKRELAGVEVYGGVMDANLRISAAMASSPAVAEQYRRQISAVLGKELTLDDIMSNKGGVRTHYAAIAYATTFLSDSIAERDARAFRSIIDGDNAARAESGRGNIRSILEAVDNVPNTAEGAVSGVQGAESGVSRQVDTPTQNGAQSENSGVWRGGNAVYSTSNGDYIKITATGGGKYSVSFGQSYELLRGFDSMTETEVKEFLGQLAADERARAAGGGANVNANADNVNGDVNVKKNLSEANPTELDNFASQLDNIDKLASNDALVICRTPQVFRDIGLNDLPMTINKEHAKDAISYNPTHPDRYIGKETLKDLPNALKSPVAIIASKTQTATSLVAIVDLKGKNGKNVITPVYVNGESKFHGIRLDTNSVSSVHERSNAIKGLLMDAINAEDKGNIGVFYINNKRATQLVRGEGLQLPNSFTNLDGSIHSISENGSPVKGSFKKIKQTETKQFKKWFKKSKVVNSDGTPKVLYHQTEGEFSVFNTENESAGKYDSDLPTGVFFKSSDRDIGLKGKKQMPAYLRIENPLTFVSRDAAVSYWRKNVDGYAEAVDSVKAVDAKYKKLFDEESKREKEEYMRLWKERQAGSITEEEYQGAVSRDRLEEILEGWTSAADEARRMAKELLNSYISNSEYDGLIIQNDVGSFGRSTDAYIVFDSTQIKSATDNIGIFDGSNPDIRYSLSENKTAQGDAAGTAERAAKATDTAEKKVGKYTAAEQDAARDAVKNFDMYEADTRRAVLEFIRSTEGLGGYDKKTVSAICGIMVCRPELSVLATDLEKGTSGMHVDLTAQVGRRLVLLDSKGDSVKLTALHEAVHDIEGTEGYSRLKRAALKYTSSERKAEIIDMYAENAGAKKFTEWLGERKFSNEALREYLKQNPKLSEEGLFSEIVAKTVAESLNKADFLDSYSNRSMFSQIISALKRLGRYLSANEQSKTAQRKTAELIVYFREAMGEGYVSTGAKVKWMSAKDAKYDPESSSIAEQIRRHQGELNKMNVVGSADVPIKYKGKPEAAKWAVERLASTGYQVDRQNFGTIYFSESDIKYGANYADTDGEKAAFAVLHKVLKRGKIIERHSDHKNRKINDPKGRPKQTITIAAPVELNGVRGNMGVVINQKDNHYYAHRILFPDGSYFTFSETKGEARQESYRGVAVNSSHADTTSLASDNSIAGKKPIVKKNISESQKKVGNDTEQSDKSKPRERRTAEQRRLEHSSNEAYATKGRKKIFSVSDAEAIADIVIKQYGFERLDRNDAVDVIHRAFNRFAVWTDYERADMAYVVAKTLSEYYNLQLTDIDSGLTYDQAKELTDKTEKKFGALTKRLEEEYLKRGINNKAHIAIERMQARTEKRIENIEAREKAKRQEITKKARESNKATKEKYQVGRAKSVVAARERADAAIEWGRAERDKARETAREKVAEYKDKYRIQYKADRSKMISYINGREVNIRKKYQVDRAKSVINSRERQRTAEAAAKVLADVQRIGNKLTYQRTTGKLANEGWKSTVSLAKKICPKYNISVPAVRKYAGVMVDFIRNNMPELMNVVTAMQAEGESAADRLSDAMNYHNETMHRNANELLGFIKPETAVGLANIAVGEDMSHLTADELEALHASLRAILSMESRMNKIFVDGKYENTDEYSSSVVSRLRLVYDKGSAFGEDNNILSTMKRHFLETLVPFDVIRIVEGRVVDGKLEDGVLSKLFRDIRKSEEKASFREKQYLAEMNDFIDGKGLEGAAQKERREWRNEFNKRELTFEITRINFRGEASKKKIKVTVGEAIQLIMTNKRDQAHDAMVLGRIGFADRVRNGAEWHGRQVDSIINEEVGELTEERYNEVTIRNNAELNVAIKGLERQLNDTDRAYMKLIEKFYASDSKRDKRNADVRYYGYTNVIEGYYVPIVRDETTRDINLLAAGSASFDNLGVNKLSFNQRTVAGANSRLLIGDCRQVVERHASQLAMYVEMTDALRAFSRVYNAKTSGTSAREYISKKVWSEFDGYINKLYDDVQRVRKPADTALAGLARKLKGKYALFSLGLNFGSVVKQNSSLLAMLPYVNSGAWITGLNPANVKKYAKIMDKYSVCAANRADTGEQFRAVGTGARIGEVGSAAMKPLAWGDRKVCEIMWSICQEQVALGNGPAVGSEANFVEAGELLDNLILEVQDTSAQSTKSAMARSESELWSALTMFRSATTKMYSALYLAGYDAVRLGKAIKNKENISAELKTSVKKRLAALGGAAIAVSLFDSAVSLIRSALRGKEDEEEEKNFIIKLGENTVTNVIGMVPVLGQAIEAISSEYDASLFYYDIFNDGKAVINGTLGMLGDAMAGKEITTQRAGKTVRSTAYFVGEVLGLPTRNLNNLVTAAMHTLSKKTAYKYNALYYAPQATDIVKAYETGNVKLANVATSQLLKYSKTGNEAAVEVVAELTRLYSAGHNVLPYSVPEELTVNGETVELSAKQRKRFRTVYAGAEDEAAKLVVSASYGEMSDEERAKAIRIVYRSHYDSAKAELLAELGASEDSTG